MGKREQIDRKAQRKKRRDKIRFEGLLNNVKLYDPFKYPEFLKVQAGP